MDARQQWLVRPAPLHAPLHVEAEDVVGALPDRVHLRVAEQPGHGPGLDIAIAAVDLDRIRCHGDSEPAHLELGDGYGNALANAPRLTMVNKTGAVEHQRLRGFDI